MKNSNSKFLLRIAQGDAYAAAVEYIKPGRYPELEIDIKKYEKFLQHPTHTGIKPVMYTDDTQMSIGVCEVLLGEDYSKQAFANAWVDAFKRDYRDGYARGFQRFLESISTGEDFLRYIKPDSEKNGAAMRSVPIGLIPDIDIAIQTAITQASITHNTHVGIWSSICVALAAHYAYHTNESIRFISPYVSDMLPLEYRKIGIYQHSGRVDNTYKTVWGALTLLSKSNSLLEMMDEVIKWGGDTDSIASICFGIGAARFREDLPDFMEYALEPGRKYGRDFLLDLGQKTVDKFGVLNEEVI